LTGHTITGTYAPPDLKKYFWPHLTSMAPYLFLNCFILVGYYPPTSGGQQLE
jgi:hypothetical protein